MADIVPSTSHAIAGFSTADVQMAAAAALLAIAITGIILLRAHFPGPLIHGDGRARRKPMRPPAAPMFGRCRWHPKADMNDKDLKAWSCASCGKVRWTSSRSEPPEACG